MTAIFYGDIDAVSPGGRFRLEAKSPDNGSIPYRDRKRTDPPTFGYQYRQHQRGFRYRLLEVAGGREQVVWERWQAGREESPHELVVSDAGWSVLRTHGCQHEVIVIDPIGTDMVFVRVKSVDRQGDWQRGPVWRIPSMPCCSAGDPWAGDSWRGFFAHAGADYFVWHTCRDDWLLIELGRGAVWTGGDIPAESRAAADAFEADAVVAHLTDLQAEMGTVRRLLAMAAAASETGVEFRSSPLWERVRRVPAAAHLAGRHGRRDAVPALREWEAVDSWSSMRGCRTFGGSWWLESQSFRPAVHHALCRLGEVPRGFAQYHFVWWDDAGRRRRDVPKCLPDRRARAAGVTVGDAPFEVLDRVGAPDFVEPGWDNEVWEYDFPAAGGWETLRLTWETEGPSPRLAKVEVVPAAWLGSDVREQRYLSE